MSNGDERSEQRCSNPMKTLCKDTHSWNSTIALEDTYPIRRFVLYPDGPDYKIHIPNDFAGTHLGAFMSPRTSDSSCLAAVISIFREDLPPEVRDSDHLFGVTPAKALRFRKFACLGDHQGRGIGSRLFESALDIARTEPDLGPGAVVWCDARWETRQWYMRRGMVVLGNTFRKGDIEYVVMAIRI